MVFRHSMADRYTYLPTLSFWILFGLALRTLWRNAVQIRWTSIAKTALVVSLCVLALAYGMRTRDQITVWGNSSLLWTHVIEKSEYVPALAYFALARVFHKEGELDKALSYFNRAHELNPKNPKYLAGMAAVLVEQKKYEEGLALYKKAARLRPSDAVYQAHLGRTYALMERPKEAEERLLKALEMDESFHSAHMLLAILYKETGRERKARERYILFKRSGGDLGGNIASSLGIASEGEDIVTAE
jgi:tetratricopeptide (TPR) repeat protein